MRQFFTTLAALAFLAVPAAQAENKSLGVHAKDFYAFATSDSQKNGAVFGTLKNVTREDVSITEVTGDVAENIELHSMSSKLGIMKMREIDAITVKPRDVVQLTPKGNHIMLMGLKAPLKVGDTLYIRINNKDGIGIQLPVQVREAGDVPTGIVEALEKKEFEKKASAEAKAKEAETRAPAPVVEEAAPEDVIEDAVEAVEEAEAELPAEVADPAAMEEKVEDAVENIAEEAEEAATDAVESITEMVKEEAPAIEATPAKPAKKSLWDKLKW